MEILFIFWLLCGVVCYFIMKSKGYPNNTCLAHGVGGALLGVFWIIFVLVKKNYDEVTSSSQLSDMELLSKMMDLKERGAITESEFEEKKREILNSVKKNKSVIQVHTLRKITILLFLIAGTISGFFCFFYEAGFDSHISYGNFLNWISSSEGAIAIMCIIMIIMLIAKADVRLLCIPIVIEATRWFVPSCRIQNNLSNIKIENFTVYYFLNTLCALSTILFLILILFLNKQKIHFNIVVLYTIPGIGRLLYAIYWFFNNFDKIALFQDIEDFSWCVFVCFDESARAILYIAFILLVVRKI